MDSRLFSTAVLRVLTQSLDIFIDVFFMSCCFTLHFLISRRPAAIGGAGPPLPHLQGDAVGEDVGRQPGPHPAAEGDPGRQSGHHHHRRQRLHLLPHPQEGQEAVLLVWKPSLVVFPFSFQANFKISYEMSQRKKFELSFERINSATASFGQKLVL